MFPYSIASALKLGGEKTQTTIGIYFRMYMNVKTFTENVENLPKSLKVKYPILRHIFIFLRTNFSLSSHNSLASISLVAMLDG